MRALADRPEFCHAYAVRGAPECDGLYPYVGQVPSPPGGLCEWEGDCARPAEGWIDCQQKHCQVQMRGKEGDGPCLGTVHFDRAAYPAFGLESGPKGFFCHLSDGLRCSGSTTRCERIARVGEACIPEMAACESGAYCEPRTRSCQTRKPEGATCETYVLASCSGYCDDTTRTCGRADPVGAACADSSRCPDTACVNGRCAPPQGPPVSKIWEFCRYEPKP
jgi:hypothetical protein